MKSELIRSTTILGVRVGKKIAIGGDGQVTMGDMQMKSKAVKVRSFYNSIPTSFVTRNLIAVKKLIFFQAKKDKKILTEIEKLKTYIKSNYRVVPIRGSDVVGLTFNSHNPEAAKFILTELILDAGIRSNAFSLPAATNTFPVYCDRFSCQVKYCQTKSFLRMGSRRTRLPVAAKTAFATAGPISGVPASPRPPGASWFSMRCTFISGVSLSLSIG